MEHPIIVKAGVSAVCVAVVGLAGAARPVMQAVPLPTPGFHHLHLNAVNVDAALGFYTRAFPVTSRDTFEGLPALRSPNNVLVLFNQVATPPATAPPTAFWHFGWHVKDVHAAFNRYRDVGLTVLPLYTGDGNGTVFTNSDTWPGLNGALGLTKAGIADAKAKGIKPTGGAGFAYLRGPDEALVEFQGDMQVERFNHVHFFQDQPFCALLWYQSHLNAPAASRGGQPVRTATDCRVAGPGEKTFPSLDWEGTYRMPVTPGVTFGDVSFNLYMNQTGRPAASTRGHLMDHVALSVTDLDAWLRKLRAERVTILEQPYNVGRARAFMIEGPSREAIELIEVKSRQEARGIQGVLDLADGSARARSHR